MTREHEREERVRLIQSHVDQLAMAREFIDEDQARTWRSVMNPED